MSEHEWSYSRAWRYLAVAALWPPLRVIIKHDWHGRQHVPRDGGVILAANHLSYADWPAVGLFSFGSGRFPVFLIKSPVFRVRVVGPFLRKIGEIPVERGSTDAGLALRGAEEAVRRGECVVFYPEGTATRDPDLWPMRAKTGVARLALTTGAPVIPVAHWGAQDVLPYGSTRPHLLPRRPVRLVAGPPVDLSAFAGEPLTASTLRAATAAIMADITVLLAGLRGQEPPAHVHDPTAGRPPALPDTAAGGPVTPPGPPDAADGDPAAPPGEGSVSRTDGGEGPGHDDRGKGAAPKAPLA